MNLSQIMNNIYGESSSQSFDHISLTGGYHAPRHTANVKYIDEQAPEQVSYTQSYRASKIYENLHSNIDSGYTFSNDQFMRGGTKSSSDVTLTSAEYVDDPDFKLFVKEFYLHYTVVNAHRNSIFIIPPSSTLKKLIDDFKNRLKSENIAEYTSDASKFASKNELPFKEYIFDIYGKDSPNNNGFDYQVTSDFPKSGMTNVLRRTNRLSHVLFFKFAKRDDIKVSADESMTSAKSLEFVAKCDNDVFILKGELPSTTSSVKNSNVVTATINGAGLSGSLTGGKRSRKSPRKKAHKRLFKSLIRKYDGDIDQASYEYIASVGLAETELNNNDPTLAVKHLIPHYSGDYIHTAMSILSECDDYPCPAEAIYASDDVDEIHSELIDAYQPKSVKIDMKTAKSAIKGLFKSLSNSSNLDNSFINGIKKMYGKYPASILKADVATSILKNNPNEETFDYAVNLMNDIDDELTGPADDTSMSGGHVQNSLFSLASSVYSALKSAPFIGISARAFTPMLMGGRRRKRIMKRKIGKKAFEDTNELDMNPKPFDFTIDNEQPVETNDPPLVVESINESAVTSNSVNVNKDNDDSDDEFRAFY